jgi:hypothetical protein
VATTDVGDLRLLLFQGASDLRDLRGHRVVIRLRNQPLFPQDLFTHLRNALAHPRVEFRLCVNRLELAHNLVSSSKLSSFFASTSSTPPNRCAQSGRLG